MHVSKISHSIFDKMTHTVIRVTQFFCTLRGKSSKPLRRGRMSMRHEVDMHKKPKSYIVHIAFFVLTNDACHTPRKKVDLGTHTNQSRAGLFESRLTLTRD